MLFEPRRKQWSNFLSYTHARSGVGALGLHLQTSGGWGLGRDLYHFSGGLSPEPQLESLNHLPLFYFREDEHQRFLLSRQMLKKGSTTH
jgi:hypothetical protein